MLLEDSAALLGLLLAFAGVSLSAWLDKPWIDGAGSVLIGVLYVLIAERAVLHADWRSIAMVGFLGAYTTFSTFSLETVTLLEHGLAGQALGYMLASVLLCVGGAWAGIVLTRLLLTS